jgi:hypothetical protein
VQQRRKKDFSAKNLSVFPKEKQTAPNGAVCTIIDLP